jgi:hypothetical protein
VQGWVDDLRAVLERIGPGFCSRRSAAAGYHLPGLAPL